MNGNKFRMATLLRLRENTRDERRMELADAQRAESLLRRQLDGVNAELMELREMARRAAGLGSVEIERLVEAGRYQRTLETRRSAMQEQLATHAAEIDRRRELLLTADREVRVLEKLRETQDARRRQAESRREIKQLDEATQLRVAVGN